LALSLLIVGLALFMIEIGAMENKSHPAGGKRNWLMTQAEGGPLGPDTRARLWHLAKRPTGIVLLWLTTMVTLDMLFSMWDAGFDRPLGRRSLSLAPYFYGPFVTYGFGIALLWNMKGSSGFKVTLAVIFGILAAGATIVAGIVWLLGHMA
jgi:hypothetical protein